MNEATTTLTRADQQWRVLRLLGEHGSLEMGRVAREAYISGPSLTGVVARMERDGLILRERDQTDQRRTLVMATSKGLTMLERLTQVIASHYRGRKSPSAVTTWRNCTSFSIN